MSENTSPTDTKNIIINIEENNNVDEGNTSTVNNHLV